MSTRIYGGYRLAAGSSLHAFLGRVRDTINPVRDGEDVKLLATIVAGDVCGRWLRGESVPPGAADTAYECWAETQAAMNPNDWDHDVNRFELSTGTDPATGRVMVILRTENENLRSAFEAMEEVEEYGYWNNSDSYPLGVTRADWEIRGDAWDRMLPGSGQVSRSMTDWALRDGTDVRPELRVLGGTGPDFASAAPTLAGEHGMDPHSAVLHAMSGDVRPHLTGITGVVAAHLPALTVELLTAGSSGAVIDPGYAQALRAACATVYDRDDTVRTTASRA